MLFKNLVLLFLLKLRYNCIIGNYNYEVIMKHNNILITGGAGFIGSNFILYLLGKYSNIRIINLDLLTYAGNLDYLTTLQNHSNYVFIQGDINDKSLVAEIFECYHINAVIHFAAESHVDNSIANPSVFIQTNVNGTLNLLQTAYSFWFYAPFTPKPSFENSLFHHISTDEVFGQLGATGYFSESSAYAPNSPYSASKASSDFLVRSFSHTYGLNTLITNCSNNYGPHQHDEKLIPTIIRNALLDKEIPIYGDGQNIRDWLFVADHCSGIEQAFYNSLKTLRNKYCIKTKNAITCQQDFTMNTNHIMQDDVIQGGGQSMRNISKEDLAISEMADKKIDLYHTESGYFDTFCIGANEEHKNYDIAYTICTYLDSYMPKKYSFTEQISFVKDRAGHDRRYAIDSTKIQKLGWKPKESFQSGIIKTIHWYIQKYKTEYG